MNDKQLFDRYHPISEAIEMAQDLRGYTPGQVRIASFLVSMGLTLVAAKDAPKPIHDGLMDAAEMLRVMFFKLARQAEKFGDLP